MPQLLAHGPGPFARSGPGIRARLSERALATVLLIVLAPFMLLVGLLVLVSSPGPVLVQAPRAGPNGRFTYRTEFRTTHCLDADTYEALRARPDPWQTPMGPFLRATRLNRVPVLLDVRARRLTLAEAFAKAT